MTIFTTLALGFLLGMRHATDADHVVALSTIVSRGRPLPAAMRVGAMWGVGHTATIVAVGAILLGFGLVIPPLLESWLELAVAAMLVVLGIANLARARSAPDPSPSHAHNARSGFRPFVIGSVHGLAGSAAVTLLVLAATRDAAWGMLYLGVFGLGTVVGMAVLTTVMAWPMAAASRRFESFEHYLVRATGLGSIAFGLFLAYQIAMTAA